MVFQYIISAIIGYPKKPTSISSTVYNLAEDLIHANKIETCKGGRTGLERAASKVRYQQFARQPIIDVPHKDIRYQAIPALRC